MFSLIDVRNICVVPPPVMTWLSIPNNNNDSEMD